MKKVLVLGAGLIARPLVRYLLDRGFAVKVASRTASRAEALVGGRRNGSAEGYDVADDAGLDRLVSGCDLAVSLLPYVHHVKVAKACLKRRRDMVTTSYVSDAMRALDGEAREKGIVILGEIGVDPGIDHMSAMRVIDAVRSRGGRVVSFRSNCGGLPAPEANDNPFGYKFSWSPRGVLLAARNDGKYLEEGRVVEVQNDRLFTATWPLWLEGIGDLEIYTNRDCLGYVRVYGLEGIRTMFRGTIRYRGFCETLNVIRGLGMLDDAPVSDGARTAREYLARFVPGGARGDLRKALAARAGLPEDDAVLDRLAWLGLFEDRPLDLAGRSSLDVLTAVMLERMSYRPGERDLLILLHEFLAEYPGGRRERITSTMIDYGIPDGDTSMARTVSLPAAIAVRMILEKELALKGVQISTPPEVYRPVLKELEGLGIRCEEKTAPAGEGPEGGARKSPGDVFAKDRG